MPRPTCAILALMVAALSAATADADAQELRGRVVDDENRRPVAEAAVELRAGDRVLTRTETAADGFFRFTLPPAGEYSIHVSAAGFTDGVAPARIPADAAADIWLPALPLKSAVIGLEAVEVNAERERPQPDATAFPVAAPSARVAGARLARLEAMSATTESVLRQLSGIRIRTYTPYPGRQPITCVETTRRTMSIRGETGACQNVAVFVNGHRSGNQDDFIRGIRIADYESIEFLTPLDAGQRFGFDGSTSGVLMLWTRGNGPHRSAARNPNGG